MKNRYNELLKSSLIFTIGNIGSKVIGVLMIPLYTHTLNPTEFGTIDLITITIGLLIPIFTLAIVEALIKFILDIDYPNKSSIVTNGVLVLLLGFIILLFLYPLISYIEALNDYILLLYAIFFFKSFSDFVKQFCRATKKNFLYVSSDILYTFTFALLNIFCLVILNLGVEGYLYSLLVTAIITLIFLTFTTKIYTYINYKLIDSNLLKKMINYSFPLMPNSIMWWLINMSNRYLIVLFLGISANGIYSIANRFPTIITTVSDIFFKAWQISAIEEAKNADKDKFYTNVFNVFFFNMIFIGSMFIVVNKYLVTMIVDAQYIEIYKYIPILIVGAIFSSISSFIGTNYTAMNNTKGALWTSTLGAITNVILNILLIPIMGLLGAGVATAVSFLIITFLRIINTRKFVLIKFPVSRIIISLLLLLFQVLLVFINIIDGVFITLNILISIVIFFVGFKYTSKLFTAIKRNFEIRL